MSAQSRRLLVYGLTLIAAACSNDEPLPPSEVMAGTVSTGRDTSDGSTDATSATSTEASGGAAGTAGTAGTAGHGDTSDGGPESAPGDALAGDPARDASLAPLRIDAAVDGGPRDATTGSGNADPAGCPVAFTGTASRPQLTGASAACFTADRYLAQAGTIGALTTDNWNPNNGLSPVDTLVPTLTVAADGSGTHRNIQAAIAQAKASGSTARVNILVKPGVYRELVCVDGTVPITLYGAAADASGVSIVFDNYNARPVDVAQTNACSVPTAATYGTSGSSTMFVKANGFQALNLTIANDFAEGASTTGVQAVALTVQGDRAVFKNVRLLGNQDTLQLRSSSGATVARSYFTGSYIEGDVDFIFGRGVAVFEGCTIHYVGARKTNSTHLAPSTESTHPFGFLVTNSKITGATGITGTTFLGRAWDDSSATAPNGQAVIKNSEIGGHIVVASPWTSAATTGRAFNAQTNRLYEYANTGAGAAR